MGAGVDVFTTGGPNAGTILTAVKIPGTSPPTDDTVFVGTQGGGVFKSVDGATTWSPANTGLTDLTVTALAIGDAGPPIVIYAGTAGGGVFKSADGGATWAPVNPGITTLSIQALAAAASDPDTLYAGTAGGGVFVTTNAGVSWSAPGTIADPNVQSLVVCPCDPLTAYAGTATGGVFKTTNGGAVWNPANTGFVGLGSNQILGLTIGDASNPDVLYAATRNGVFSTTDAAVNWAPDSAGLTTTFVDAIFLEKPGSLPRTIIAGTDVGVFVGTDTLGTGATWVLSNGTAPDDLTNLFVTAIAVNPIIYAGTQGNGIFLTTDGGSTWSEMNDGLRAAKVSSLVTEVGDSTIIFAGAGAGGVHQSVDSGVSWAHVNNSSLTDPVIVSMARSPTGELYAGTLGGGIFQSLDDGVNWTAVNTGDLALPPYSLGGKLVYALAVDPFSSTTAYAAVETGGVIVGLFKTTNAGGSWTNLGIFGAPPNPAITAIAMDAVTLNTLYVAVPGVGVLKSIDGGTSFNPASAGLTNTSVRDLTMSVGSSLVLFAATAGGVFRSVDSAGSWTPGNTGLTSLDVKALHSRGFGVLVAGTGTAGVFGSVDNGQTWAPLNNGLTNLKIKTLSRLAPPGNMYVGTDGGGVFEYTPTFQPLTVTLAGTGTGTVSGLPGPLNCMGPTCGGGPFFTNTAVTLTATPTAGSVLVGWSGGGCSGAGTCTVFMTGPIAVTATFALIPPGNFTLTVTKAGGGTGSVAVAPAGLTCDATCVGLGVRMISGSIATLTGTPTPGTFFVGWSGGGCTGTAPCTLPLIADTTVSATFGAPAAVVTGPGPGGGPHVRSFAASGLPGGASFMAYAPTFSNGLYVAAGRITGPGPVQIITGAGAGGGPHVRVFNPDGSDFGIGFFAYDPAFVGGVRVAAGDVDGDGRDEIIVAAGPGGGPHVRIFRVEIGPPPSLIELAGFFAFDPLFVGGVFVAAADVDGDGRAEIIVGADAGGGPHVRVFKVSLGPPVTLTELAGFYAFDPLFSGGVRVAAADLDGDGKADLIVGAGPGGLPEVRAWSGASFGLLADFLAYPAAFTGGVFVAGGQVDGTGAAEIVTGPGTGWNPHVRAFTAALAEVASFFAYDPLFLGGVRVSSSP